ncbi:MAG TPA: IPExxxVDY family protein [Bacteroidales bacterium]|nr:IPExxxVDY family protein [Bacteroidales bacterium]
MAPKKRVLQVQPFDDIVVIGISTTLSDYKLTWHLNEALKIDLKKMPGFQGATGEIDPYSFYYYDGGENENIFSLLQLAREGHRLLAMSVPVDYLMVVRNSLKSENLARMLQAIRSIRDVMAAWQIEPEKTKGMDPLLEALEFHELSLLRQPPPRKFRPS